MATNAMATIALATIALAAQGCGQLHDLPPDVEVGSAGFVVAGDLNIVQLDYTVSGNGIPEITGSISLRDLGAAPEAIIGGIPAGTGYLLQLRATSDDGRGTCYGAASFDVRAGQSSPIDIRLVCATDSTIRTKMVNGILDYCPSLASYAAAPPSAPVGGSISLTATAFSFYSDPPTFSWQASAGTLSATDSALAIYTCISVGAVTLTVQVTDGLCPDTATLTVTCTAAAADGGVDAGADAG
jgi:hypothetical protein